MITNPNTSCTKRISALSVAGFDPSGGAGVLSDIKTFEQHNLRGFGVTTAITYQNDNELIGLDWIEKDAIIKQISVLQKRFNFSFAKVGLVENLEVFKAIIVQLKKQNTQIIWDPIISSSSGFNFHSELNKKDLIEVLKDCLIITPNKSEFHILNLICLLKKYTNVLVKGGHDKGFLSIDILYTKGEEFTFSKKRHEFSKHGSGCVLSSAITSNLCNGQKLNIAIKNAKYYTNQYLQSDESLLGIHKNLNTIDKNIEKLHFVTQEYNNCTHVDVCEKALEAGVKWVQLRMKRATFNQMIAVGEKCKELCSKHKAKFIINDKVDVALALDADGVHLGKNDCHPLEARKILGDTKIIGATANTFDDVKKLSSFGVDYVGLGPYKFTNTKKKLSPILGLQGYRKIINKCTTEGIHTPIIAIGGIQIEDIQLLMEHQLAGIAVSGLIASSDNRKPIVNKINNLVEVSTLLNKSLIHA